MSNSAYAVQTKLNKAVGVTAVAEGTTNGTVSVTTNGTTADVNSLYPNVMRYEKLPYGVGIFYQGKYIISQI